MSFFDTPAELAEDIVEEAPEPEPEPEPEPVRLVYSRPGSIVLDDGRTFVFNRPFTTTPDDAEFLLSIRRNRAPVFFKK